MYHPNILNNVTGYRTERDSIGEKQVPSHVYFGVQTLRAFENFRITGLAMHNEIINSVAQIKKAAALANLECGLLDKTIADAIVQVCDEIVEGKLHDQFIVDPIQGGAGTSLNMNANEVIANRAIELLGGEKGDYSIVHPNDHVNMGQSTNDVIPTAGKITSLKLLQHTHAELDRLYDALTAKAKEFDHVLKMGRTQMQDAVPIRLGQEFASYACAIKRDIGRIDKVAAELKSVNMGGTAVGTCINADIEYVKRVVPILDQVTGLDLVPADNLVDATQNLDAFVAVSSITKTCAINLSKMANDLRLMSSGPFCGFGEINLPPRQNGSSIMPGKVNPVIPEVVNQVCFNIIGNDMTVTMAAEAGQLELNAFEPIVFYCLFQSIDTLGYAVATFTDNCISGITANVQHCQDLVDNSVGIVTALCPYIGYARAATLAKEAAGSDKTIRQLVLEQKLLTPEQLDSILDPFAMTEPTPLDKELSKACAHLHEK